MYIKTTSTPIDMTDSDKYSSALASTIDNEITTSTLTATRTPPNLASDWCSADSASGGWIDHHGFEEGDDDDSDDPEEQEQFDRISGILSQLIQEANNAINSTSCGSSHPLSTPMAMEEEEDDDMMENTPMVKSADNLGWSTVSTMDDSLLHGTDDFSDMDETPHVRSTAPLPIHPTSPCESHTNSATVMERIASASTSTNESRRRSRLPRPKKLTLETLHHRSSSTMSVSSSSSSNMDYDDDTLFSPVSASSMTTPMSRTISPLLFEKGLYTQLSRQGSAINNEADLALLCSRAVQNQRERDDSESDQENLQDSDPLMSPSGSLLASFERLDSSLAIVDSLSRDLANCRRQHPRQRNSADTILHPMTSSTSLSSMLTDISLDLVPSTKSQVETTTTTTPAMTTTSFDDDNTYSKQQHYDGRSHGDRKWMTVLIVGPILYIPYLLMASLWNQILVSTATETTSSFSLLLSTVSAMMFDDDDDRHTFASLKSTLITSTAAIGNGGGGNGMVPPCAGLAVFLLFLAILHLLKGGGDCATMDQDNGGSDGRQFMTTTCSSYNDRSKMIRRSSLPTMPCSPSLSRRNSF